MSLPLYTGIIFELFYSSEYNQENDTNPTIHPLPISTCPCQVTIIRMSYIACATAAGHNKKHVTIKSLIPKKH